MSDQEDRKPNVLIFLTDQQRFDTIAAAGYSHMKTPNIDRLVTEGCLFRNAYTPNPICVPARHCLLTGAPPSLHGFHDNQGKAIIDDGLPTLPQILAENGYFTGAVGKMHYRPTRNHNGFLEMHLMEEIPQHLGDDAYAMYLAEQGYEDVRSLHGVRPLIYHEPQRALMPAEHHGEAWVAKKTKAVLERHEGRPFFLMCGFIKPHPPWNIPDEWAGLYDGSELPEPIPPCREEPYFAGESPWYGDNDSSEHKRAIRAAYYTSISLVDHQIGVILDDLAERGILDDTFIIFTSDHGEMLQDRGMYQKAKPFESAAHIPFVVRSPRHFAPGTEDNRFVDLMDILPTVLDVTGIDYYEKSCREKYTLPGVSLLNDKERDQKRGYQFSELGRDSERWVFVRDQKYKYIYFYGGAFERLYDLEDDPMELRNLIGTDQLPEADYHRLKQKLIEYEINWGPEGAVQNGELTQSSYEPFGPHEGHKFPWFANNQMPKFGTKEPEWENDRLIREIKYAAGEPPRGWFTEMAPEEKWLDHWREKFRHRGGTPEQENEIE